MMVFAVLVVVTTTTGDEDDDEDEGITVVVGDNGAAADDAAVCDIDVNIGDDEDIDKFIVKFLAVSHTGYSSGAGFSTTDIDDQDWGGG